MATILISTAVQLRTLVTTYCVTSRGGRYYSLIKGPTKLSKPGSNDVPQHFDTFPSFYGTGISLTLWYRHCDPGDKAVCGVYLVYAGDSGVESDSYCWSIWVQNNGVYLDNVDADPPYFYLLDFMASEQTLNHMVWRHLAFVWNVADDHFSVYLDGELGVRVPWGSSVSAMDCSAIMPPGLNGSALNGSANASGQSGRVVGLGHGIAGVSSDGGSCCCTLACFSLLTSCHPCTKAHLALEFCAGFFVLFL
jgi:hypothetical protein